MLYSELESYFKIRFEELLNKKTPDSYRVKNHNVLSILNELCELIEGWQKHRLQTAETVVLCAKESRELIDSDKWIDYTFYDKELFIKDIDEYIKILPDSKDKREGIYEMSSKLVYTCRKCIDHNSSTYAENLFSYMLGEIDKPGDMDKDGTYNETMMTFDKALSALCSELLRLGHSKNHLYLKAVRLFNGEIKVEDLKKQLLAQKETTYEVIYKLQSNTYIDSCKAEYGFVDDLEDIKKKLTNQKGEVRFASFLSNNGSDTFKVFKVDAIDTYAAIKKAKDNMALLLDTLHLGSDANTGRLEPEVVLLSKAPSGGYYSSKRNHDYQLDGDHESNPHMSKLLKTRVDHILNSAFVKDDVKDRLKSSLRHLRMANDSKDLELRFVNYWIALEFIFSSPISHESTFSRIKKHLINVLCYSYISRNVHYLDSLLHSEKVLDENKSLSDMTDDEWGMMIDQVSNIRTQYRLCQMKANLHSKKIIGEYVATHRQHLEWHIARIYRMRNELIHEAALKQDIEGTTSNLRFYLVFIMNQMADFFYNSKIHVGINDFFHHYENLANAIFANRDRNYALGASYEAGLMR